MSRGFVKEGDQEEVPIIPPRADLPPGTVNYVTKAGYAALLTERDKLIHERDDLPVSNENDKRITSQVINAKLKLLSDRITSARVIDLTKQPGNKVLFGAEVTFVIDSETKTQTFQIVGVDEANIAQRKIAFTSPIARALMDKKVGETAILKLERSEKKFKIVSINYPDETGKLEA